MRVRAALLLAAGLAALAGCRGAHDDGAQSAGVQAAAAPSGYLEPPRATTAMVTRDGAVRVFGLAPPHAAVELMSPEGERAQVNADRRGAWSVRLAGGRPRLYAISAMLGERTVHAEGGLVTAPGALAAAVSVRAGDAARPLLAAGATAIATVDYDPSGVVAVAGRAPGGGQLSLSVDGAPVAVGQADPQGRYALFATNHRLSLGAHRLQVRAPDRAAERVAVLEPAAPLSAPFRAEPIVGGGWRVDWALTGGGEQTTLILPPDAPAGRRGPA